MSKTLETRFWEKVNITDTCWLWTGATSDGYGSFGFNGKMKRVHRLAYAWAKGVPVDSFGILDHLCRVKNCVNPDHLEEVSQAENVRRGDSANRDLCRRGLHPWTRENIIKSPSSRPRCRTCNRATRRRNKEAKNLSLIHI